MSGNTPKLKSNPNFKGVKGPVLLVVMDGIGIGRNPDPFNAVVNAHKPGIDRLAARSLGFELFAHGRHVGLPDDDLMGNSEVGHNALGAGFLIAQGSTLVHQLIQTGEFGKSKVLNDLMAHTVSRGSAMHLMGLIQRERSVHAHTDHLKAIVDAAMAGGVKKLFVHGLTDGRDDPEGSAIETIRDVEAHLARYDGNGRICMFASGGGRMVMTMDRYWADPLMLELGWKTHVRGEGRRFGSASEAVRAYYDESGNASDQYCFPFVVARDCEPVGPIRDGDSVIFFNYRGDRAKEMSKAFEDEEFTFFNRGPKPDVMFAGLLSYDPEENVPRRYLVEPPGITGTVSELLAGAGLTQLALSETQKFGHVTYFWNGNRADPFDAATEKYVEIISDPVIEFRDRPWMKAAEITLRTIEHLKSGKHRFLRINYPNGDMVGHTGSYEAVSVAVASVSLGISRLMPVVEALGGAMVVTADHGNAEEMAEVKADGTVKTDKNGVAKPKTSHTTNKVPMWVFAPGLKKVAPATGAGLPGGHEPLTIRNAASTALDLLGFKTPEHMEPSLIRIG